MQHRVPQSTWICLCLWKRSHAGSINCLKFGLDKKIILFVHDTFADSVENKVFY